MRDRKVEPFEDPFIKILPHIDLHGETTDTVVWPVKDFISMQIKLGKDKICIVHGHNHGSALKNAIHAYLKTDTRVKRYYLYNFNSGITVAELKVEDD